MDRCVCGGLRDGIPRRSTKWKGMEEEEEEEDKAKRQEEEEIPKEKFKRTTLRRRRRRRRWRGIPTMVLVHERGGSRGCREGWSERVETEPNARPCDERGRAKSWSRNVECLRQQREELSMSPSPGDFVVSEFLHP
jgi:hypothetical protein